MTHELIWSLLSNLLLKYTAIILHTVLYAHDTWCPALWEPQCLCCWTAGAGKIFGTKSEEVTGDLRKLHNEKLHNLCSSAIIRMIARMGWLAHVACMRDMRTVHTILEEKSDKK
jgi:hypothetical protein